MQPDAIDPKQYSDMLAAARKGDSQVLGELLKGCEAEVGSGIGKQIPNHHRAAFDETDVMSVTFLEAFLGFHKFLGSSRSQFVGWIRAIAEHNLRDACAGLEAKKRPPPKLVAIGSPDDYYTNLLEQLSGSATTPSRHFAQGEMKAKVDAAIDALPQDYRRVVRLHDFEGQSFRDIAAVMAKSLGFVHMLHVRAFDRLREFLGTSTNFFSS